jgi:hypothetical protein
VRRKVRLGSDVCCDGQGCIVVHVGTGKTKKVSLRWISFFFYVCLLVVVVLISVGITKWNLVCSLHSNASGVKISAFTALRSRVPFESRFPFILSVLGLFPIEAFPNAIYFKVYAHCHVVRLWRDVPFHPVDPPPRLQSCSARNLATISLRTIPFSDTLDQQVCHGVRVIP